MKKWFLMISLIILVFIWTGCAANPDVPSEVRAGEWQAAADFAEFTFTVSESGTAVTQAIVDFSCASNGVSITESLSLSASGEGWPITNGKFKIDFSDTSVKLKISGKFNDENNQASGSIKVRTCSGNWEASR